MDSSSSPNNYYMILLNNLISHMYRYGNLIIYILGIIGNLLSIAIFLKKKWRKNVCVFYFLICLLLSLVYLNCTILITSLTTGWNIKILHLNTFVCKMIFYTTFVTSTLMPTILIFASIDRLLISSQNVDTRLYSSRRLAYLLLTISTIFWMIFNVHILIKVNIQQFNISVFICYYDLSSSYQTFVNYSLTVLNCFLCLLMIILSVLSFKNVRRIRAVPRQLHRQVRSMRKRDFQLLRCLYIQDIVYISVSIISSFYAVYKMITIEKKRTTLEKTIADFLEKFFTFIYFTFHCSNFFIFICVSRSFREEVKQIVYKIIGKDALILRAEEQLQPQQQQVNLKNNDIELNISVICANQM